MQHSLDQRHCQEAFSNTNTFADIGNNDLRNYFKLLSYSRKTQFSQIIITCLPPINKSSRVAQ